MNDSSFGVFPGQVLGLLGPNGAGKTTTIDVITAQTGASKGKVDTVIVYIKQITI